MNKDDRNTILMLLIVLIVSIVALVAVVRIAWGLAGKEVVSTVNSISKFIKIQRMDYNFEIPPAEEVEETDDPSSLFDQHNVALTVNPTSKLFNYNFPIPARDEDDDEFQIVDAIVEDALLASYNANYASQTGSFNIQIPKIGVAGTVYQGLGANELLKKGFWVYPSSGELGQGEAVILCHRRYFGSTDPRTCWFLDQMTNGDSIFIDVNGYKLEYIVTAIEVHTANDPAIYSISDKDAIKVVTCTPLYSNTHRLVVKAERKM
jgi:LPXTG-site transpeptidase (sortase) family protein